MAKKVLTEKEVEKVYEIVRGFETSDGKRFEVGKENFVFEKDFNVSDWKALLEMECVKLAEKPQSESEKETIVFEEVEK